MAAGTRGHLVPSSSASSGCVTARRPLPCLHLAFSASEQVCLCLLLQGPWRSRVGPEGAELSPSRGITKHIKGDGCHTAPAFPCCQWSRAGAGQPQPSTTGPVSGGAGSQRATRGERDDEGQGQGGAGGAVLWLSLSRPEELSAELHAAPLPSPDRRIRAS